MISWMKIKPSFWGWLSRAKPRMALPCALVVAASLCLAASPIVHLKHESVSGTGWDPADPTNLADLRAFVSMHWDGLWEESPTTIAFLHEHGAQSMFHRQLPSVFYQVYVPYLEVFGRIYEHRLSWSEDPDECFDLIDLMQADAEVRSQFKSFILTGRLESKLAIDADAFFQHYLLVFHPDAGPPNVSVDCISLEDDRLLSEGLKVEPATVAVPYDDCLIPALLGQEADSPCLCKLRWLARASPLACMFRNGLWQADPLNIPSPPDDYCNGGAFDCDDFTDAVIRWLLSHDLQDCGDGSEFFRLPIFWRCGEGSDIRGHLVPVVIIDGKRYIVDPYTGNVLGPFGGGETEFQRMLKCGYETTRGGPEHCAEQDGSYRPIDVRGFSNKPALPRWFRSPTEPGYKILEPRLLWVECEESKRRFCERLGECCRSIPSLGRPVCPSPLGLGLTDEEILLRSCSLLEDFHEAWGPCSFPCPNCQTLPPPAP